MNYKRYSFAVLLAMLLSLGASGQDRIRLTGTKQKHNTVVSIDKYRVTVTPEKTYVSLDFVLDSLRVPSNRYRAFTPILRSPDGRFSHRFQTLLVTGRVQDIVFERDGIDPLYRDHCVTVRRDGNNIQRYSYTDAVDFSKWHKGAEVWLESDLCGCGDTLKSEQARLGRIPNDPVYHYVDVVPPPSPKLRSLHGTAFITFVVDRWEMKPDYMDNRRELRKITDTLDVMTADRNITVKQIKIHGWASPESPYEHNRMLATNRAKSLTEYVRTLYGLPASVFAPAEATPENWIGLREAVEQLPTSVLPHRREILALIDDGSLEPDPKEWRLKRQYPQEYRYLLREVYPRLRRSDYEISFNIREFTLEEAVQIYREKPHQLSLRELWDVAQTFAPGSAEYNGVMQTAVNLYPDSTEAVINLANVALRQDDLLKAETLLQHAGQSAEAENARAILYMKRRQWPEAEAALRRAQQLGMDVSENMQTVEEQR